MQRAIAIVLLVLSVIYLVANEAGSLPERRSSGIVIAAIVLLLVVLFGPRLAWFH